MISSSMNHIVGVDLVKYADKNLPGKPFPSTDIRQMAAVLLLKGWAGYPKLSFL